MPSSTTESAQEHVPRVCRSPRSDSPRRDSSARAPSPAVPNPPATPASSRSASPALSDSDASDREGESPAASARTARWLQQHATPDAFAAALALHLSLARPLAAPTPPFAPIDVQLYASPADPLHLGDGTGTVAPYLTQLDLGLTHDRLVAALVTASTEPVPLLPPTPSPSPSPPPSPPPRAPLVLPEFAFTFVPPAAHAPLPLATTASTPLTRAPEQVFVRPPPPADPAAGRAARAYFDAFDARKVAARTRMADAQAVQLRRAAAWDADDEDDGDADADTSFSAPPAVSQVVSRAETVRVPACIDAVVRAPTKCDHVADAGDGDRMLLSRASAGAGVGVDVLDALVRGAEDWLRPPAGVLRGPDAKDKRGDVGALRPALGARNVASGGPARGRARGGENTAPWEGVV